MSLAQLAFVGFLNLLAKASSYQLHPNTIPQFGRSSSFKHIDQKTVGAVKHEPERLRYYTIYQASTPPKSGYTGSMATLDIYSFPNMKNNEATGSLIWISNGNGDDPADINDIQAGWTVDPNIYGDTNIHFFVYWTADGYRSTGCFDLNCDGFVPVNTAHITPGDTLDPAGGPITVKIFKSKDDEDWWVYFGRDMTNLNPVGFWPKSIFTTLVDSANHVTWGGYAIGLRGNPSPPMGDGQWPGTGSATVQNIQLVNTDGQGYSEPVWPVALDVFTSNTKCYQASPFANNMFYYGGPGGCTK
ncbi:hypothetical protein ABZP36_033715 [Zizania latifolia]